MHNWDLKYNFFLKNISPKSFYFRNSYIFNLKSSTLDRLTYYHMKIYISLNEGSTMLSILTENISSKSLIVQLLHFRWKFLKTCMLDNYHMEICVSLFFKELVAFLIFRIKKGRETYVFVYRSTCNIICKKSLKIPKG